MTIAALKALCSRIPWCEPAVLESVFGARTRDVVESWNIGTIRQSSRRWKRTVASRETVALCVRLVQRPGTRVPGVARPRGKGGEAWHRVR